MRGETVNIGALQLDGGDVLPAVEQRVTVYSDARAGRVALIAHALTGSSRVQEWWPGLVGAGRFFDPARWCVVGINSLGGCYGSTGPSNPGEGAPTPFPGIGVRDMVRAQQRALALLGIKRFTVVVGGSLGGMQALQRALDFPLQVDRAVMIGAHDHHSPMGIALNALQREALALDPRRGLRLARKIAMLTYKSEELLRERHERRRDRNGLDRFDVEGYLEHQADLFERRMDAQTYALLTRAMGGFDVREAPAPSAPELLFIGISSDWLFRAQDVRAAAERFASLGTRSRYAELRSGHGHDAFLAEPDSLAKILDDPSG
ncbi:MAG TPA: alpha/beta fold hydrolase [Candidatus Tyrphobacter sp.]